MGGTILCKTVKEKDLGVTMNGNMKVSEQCRIVVSTDNQVLGMIRRNIMIIPLCNLLDSSDSRTRGIIHSKNTKILEYV